MRAANSLLFVSALRVDQIQKATESQADVIVLDLEDAVGPGDKELARSNLQQLHPLRECFVRINDCRSSEFVKDLDVVAHLPWLSTIVLPKVESSNDIDQLHRELRRETKVVALIESAIGIENSMEIGRSGVSRLAFGSADFSTDVGTEANDALFMYPRSRLVVTSAACRLAPPIDGPTTNFADDVALRESAVLARSLGMGGKFCIHPSQLAIVRDVFRPSNTEESWARAVLKGLADNPSGVFVVEGQMIDAPLVARAKQIVEGAFDVQ